MSAYKDAFRLSSAEQGPRLDLALEVLARGHAVVVVDDALALRAQPNEILCEVIASGNIAPDIQVERAKRLLQSSAISSVVSRRRCQWLVVEDYGTGTVELWRES